MLYGSDGELLDERELRQFVFTEEKQCQEFIRDPDVKHWLNTAFKKSGVHLAIPSCDPRYLDLG